MSVKDTQQRLINFVLAVLYPLRPHRLPDLPNLLIRVFRYWFTGSNPDPFPPVETALEKPLGLLAVGGKLTTPRIINAYREGIYPFCHLNPMKWWAPPQRMVVFPEESHIGKTLRRVLRQNRYRVTFDQAFSDVISRCAEPRPGKTPLTWISRDVVYAHHRLFEEGYAHSSEVWDQNDRLVGGCYGISIGRVFFTESQFSMIRDASKVAFTYLNCHLQAWGYRVNDCKNSSSRLKADGARLISREKFTAILEQWRDASGHPAAWQVDKDLAVAEWKPAESAARAETPVVVVQKKKLA